jgi:hypothetical protein
MATPEKMQTSQILSQNRKVIQAFSASFGDCYSDNGIMTGHYYIIVYLIIYIFCVFYE